MGTTIETKTNHNNKENKFKSTVEICGFQLGWKKLQNEWSGHASICSFNDKKNDCDGTQYWLSVISKAEKGFAFHKENDNLLQSKLTQG